MGNIKVSELERLESAVSTKYGEEAIKDPRADWSDEQEEDYQKQLKEAAQQSVVARVEKQKADGFLVVQKLVNAGADRNCDICDTYSFKIKDDVYKNKYGCCERCYIDFVEGREERWKDGWRPSAERVESSREARRSNKTPQPS